MHNQITYYDFANIHYSGFFLTGFFQNRDNFHYKLDISKAVPSLLCDSMLDGGWKKLLFSVCLFRAKLNNKEFYFCIDTRDSCKTGPTKGYHLPLLRKVKYYFKVNYNHNAIKNDLNLREFSSKIVPVALFLPLRPPRLLPFLPRMIPCSAVDWKMRNIWLRIKALGNLLTLNEMREMRNIDKDLDIFFVPRFYREKQHSHDIELRYEIIRQIRKHKNLVSITGFASSKKLPGKFAEFQTKSYTLKAYLRNLSRAKVAIYVRGLHNCLSFKLGQLLALGMPIIGQTITNNQDLLYKNEHFPSQFAFDNPKEIVENVIQLLSKPEKLKTLRESNANVFDTKFTPQAITAGVLEHLMGTKVAEITGSQLRLNQQK